MTDMTETTLVTGPAPAAESVRIRAHGRAARRLGHWTHSRRLDVRASRGAVLIDLRSPQIEAGDIEIDLDLDHSVLRLLVPDGASVDADEARRVGRCPVKDWTAVAAPDGRRVVLTGELRHAEVRIHRGGIAILSAMCSREYFADALQARREGRLPAIDDPSR
jgi:hypothetical protein